MLDYRYLIKKNDDDNRYRVECYWGYCSFKIMGYYDTVEDTMDRYPFAKVK